jgi:hypothetical protein
MADDNDSDLGDSIYSDQVRRRATKPLPRPAGPTQGAGVVPTTEPMPTAETPATPWYESVARFLYNPLGVPPGVGTGITQGLKELGTGAMQWPMRAALSQADFDTWVKARAAQYDAENAAHANDPSYGWGRMLGKYGPGVAAGAAGPLLSTLAGVGSPAVTQLWPSGSGTQLAQTTEASGLGSLALSALGPLGGLARMGEAALGRAGKSLLGTALGTVPGTVAHDVLTGAAGGAAGALLGQWALPYAARAAAKAGPWAGYATGFVPPVANTLLPSPINQLPASGQPQAQLGDALNALAGLQ